MITFFKRLFGIKKKPLPPVSKPIRRVVDTESIRVRLRRQGWTIKELPIRRHNADKEVILYWKIIAFKEMQSVESTGTNLDDAMSSVGKMLGVVPLSL